jgi:hypothetical protein
MIAKLVFLASCRILAVFASPVPDVPNGPAPQGCSKYEIIVGEPRRSKSAQQVVNVILKLVEQLSQVHLAQLLGIPW